MYGRAVLSIVISSLNTTSFSPSLSLMLSSSLCFNPCLSSFHRLFHFIVFTIFLFIFLRISNVRTTDWVCYGILIDGSPILPCTYLPYKEYLSLLVMHTMYYLSLVLIMRLTVVKMVLIHFSTAVVVEKVEVVTSTDLHRNE